MLKPRAALPLNDPAVEQLREECDDCAEVALPKDMPLTISLEVILKEADTPARITIPYVEFITAFLSIVQDETPGSTAQQVAPLCTQFDKYVSGAVSLAWAFRNPEILHADQPVITREMAEASPDIEILDRVPDVVHRPNLYEGGSGGPGGNPPGASDL
jgi:hypothetical protein